MFIEATEKGRNNGRPHLKVDHWLEPLPYRSLYFQSSLLSINFHENPISTSILIKAAPEGVWFGIMVSHKVKKWSCHLSTLRNQKGFENEHCVWAFVMLIMVPPHQYVTYIQSHASFLHLLGQCEASISSLIDNQYMQPCAFLSHLSKQLWRSKPLSLPCAFPAAKIASKDTV